MFTWAVQKRLLGFNPVQPIRQQKELNVRDEILSVEQFQTLQAHSPTHLQPINLVAYATGMRKGEILNLTWDHVDLKGGFIRLKPEDTKTRDGRLIPLSLSSELEETFRTLGRMRALHDPRVFHRDGQPIRYIDGAFAKACREAEIANFLFHDFRHTAVTNMRRAGIDQLTIMKLSGHKTMVCFTRYNSFRESDLSAAARQINTYLTRAHQTASTVLSEQVANSAISR